MTTPGDANDDALRIGVIGCGRLTEQGYLRALARVDGARLVALADPDPIRRGRAAGIAAELGDVVPTYRGITSLLERARPDALVLATPSSAHVSGAREAAAASTPVLVEKPPAPDVVGAAELAALAPAPWIAFNRRFSPGIAGLRARVADAGDVDLWCSIAYRRRSWRAHVVDDDALNDLGPHLVDWVRWLTGRVIVEVAARQLSPGSFFVDVTLDHGHAHIIGTTDRMHHEHVVCRTAAGRSANRRVARWSAGGPVRAVTGRLRQGDHPLVTSLATELDAFVRAVRREPCPDLATAADGLVVMQVIAAARESAARNGSPVPVQAPEVP